MQKILLAIALGMSGTTQVEAAYTAYLLESGINVVGNGSGTLDTTLLELHYATNLSSVEADQAFLALGQKQVVQQLFRVIGPRKFGSGIDYVASSVSGDPVSIYGKFNYLSVPWDYQSGTRIVSSAVWLDTTLSNLGVEKGTYAWTWGSGDHADSFTLHIGEAEALPEPETWATMLLGFGVTGTVARGGRGRITRQTLAQARTL